MFNKSIVLLFSIFTALLNIPMPAIAGGSFENMEIFNKEGDVVRKYTLEDLKNEYEQNTIETITPWSNNQEILYRGPFLGDLLLRHDNTGGDDIEISAHNGFISGVKRSEISQYAPILAVERNCEPQDYITEACAEGQLFRPITIPENGPIFLVWPLKELPEYYLNMRNAIWVFHVSAIAHSKK